MKVLIAITAALLVVVQARDLTQHSSNDLFKISAKPAFYNPKISGGTEAEPHSFPHAVALNIDGQSLCGGSIISKDVVLTAARCVDNATKVEIIAGAHNFNRTEPTQQRIIATTFVIHKYWDRVSRINDIALIKLNTSLTLNYAVQPIELDSGGCLNADIEFILGTVTGWGEIGRSGSSSPTLREVTSPTMSNKECKSEFYGVEDTHICLMGAHRKSFCNGDAGGALITGKFIGRKVQIGIASFPLGSCYYNDSSIFTRVACFHDWIKENL